MTLFIFAGGLIFGAIFGTLVSLVASVKSVDSEKERIHELVQAYLDEKEKKDE